MTPELTKKYFELTILVECDSDEIDELVSDIVECKSDEIKMHSFKELEPILSPLTGRYIIN